MSIDLNMALYNKCAAEQQKYRGWLLNLSAADILDHAYEYAMREDILMELEEIDLTPRQAKALLASPNAMAEIYKDFSELETNHMDAVRGAIEDRAQKNMERQHKRGQPER